MDALLTILRDLSALSPAEQQQALGPHLGNYQSNLDELSENLSKWGTPVVEPVTGLPATIAKNRQLWCLTANADSGSSELPTSLKSMLDLGKTVADADMRMESLHAIRREAIQSLERSQDITDAEIRPLFIRFMEQNDIKFDNEPVTPQQMDPRRIARLINLLENQPPNVASRDIANLLDSSSNTDKIILKLIMEQHGTTVLPLVTAIVTVSSYGQMHAPVVKRPLNKEKVIDHFYDEQTRIRNLQAYIKGLVDLVAQSTIEPVAPRPYNEVTFPANVPKVIPESPELVAAREIATKNIGDLINMEALTSRYDAINQAIKSMAGCCCNCGTGLDSSSFKKYNYCGTCYMKLGVKTHGCPMALYEHRFRSVGRVQQPTIQRNTSPDVRGDEFTTNTQTNVSALEM
jgi:hypothetical protein